MRMIFIRTASMFSNETRANRTQPACTAGNMEPLSVSGNNAKMTFM